MMSNTTNHRVLIIDDNRAIHEDFRKILCGDLSDTTINAAASALFGKGGKQEDKISFAVDSAYQGKDGLQRVSEALDADAPYTIVFVDMEMPPGWDGLETAQRLLNVDQHVQIVICTAFSNRSWSEIIDNVDESERLLIIKKPFDVEEILQLAHSLSQRWAMGHEAEQLADTRKEILAKAHEQIQVQFHERLVVETALSVTEQRLTLALDATNDGIFDWDMNTGHVYFSPRWEKMLGFDRGSVAKRSASIRRLMHPDDVGPTFRLLRAHIRGELNSFEAEYRMRRASGDWIWVLGRAKAVSRLNSKAVRVVGTHTDITERKWIEQQLLTQEAQFRSIVSNIPGVVYRRLNDKNSSITFVSNNTKTLFGYCASDFVGKTSAAFDAIIHESDRVARHRSIQNAVLEMEPYSVEYRILDATGNTRWVLEKGSAVAGSNAETQYLDGVIFDVTETRTLTEQLTYRDHHDELTGLINRKQFTRELQKAVAATGDGDTDYALCYMDLDNFKVANDTCGHVGGDQLLGELGQSLCDHLRDHDIVARLGGDEFGILLRDCSGENLERVSASICKIAEDFRFDWDGKTLRIAASVGVIAIDPSARSVEDLLRLSESACYVAKEAGRNRAHIYRKDDSVVVKRTDEMQWVPRIHRALDENRFQLWQQPIIPMSGDIDLASHYEVLIRLQTRSGAIASPGEFLPAAERFNLATKIDRWVITNTIEWLAIRPDHVRRLKTCSINLSGQSLTDEAFCEYILKLVSLSGIPPEKLCFEVTETTAVANMRSAERFLEALRRHGCQTALDDFGAGLSSFGYLANLPVDFIKIDGMFVKDIADNPVHFAMVRAINEVGQLMGKKTVAEFVESDAVAEKLRDIGVDYGQGYGIGRPRPIDELDTTGSTSAVASGKSASNQ